MYKYVCVLYGMVTQGCESATCGYRSPVHRCAHIHVLTYACRAILLNIGSAAHVARCIRDPMMRRKVIAREFRLRDEREREGVGEGREKDAQLFSKNARNENKR